MALHKLEIRNERLMLDDARIGALATSAPDGVSASTVATSIEEGGVVLSVRWTVERTPSRTLPLEILRLRLQDFLPKAAFIGGRRYELSGTEPPRGARLGFPYNTYYKFKIDSRFPYDAALFSKMPVACWQEENRAFALVFPKELTVPQGRLPVFIRASGPEAIPDFSAAILPEFEIRRKPFGWFGTRTEHSRQNTTLLKGHSFEATFLLVAADTWAECIRACENYLYRARRPTEAFTVEALAKKLMAALRFYDRVWDGHNRTHAHLPVKNVPRFESVEFKHSHITDDITKLVLYRRLLRTGCREVLERERQLLVKLIDKSYRYELDGADLWHTTAFFNGVGLKTFTHHGAGFVGFPGGMATVVRRLFEYCSLNHNDSVEELARSGADWLLTEQGKNGSWPASVEDERAGTHTGCVGSTAEAVRALVATYRQTEEPYYRSAAEAGIGFIDREESFFECKRYLRDIEPDEADGISAEACIHANLDWYSLTHGDDGLEQAKNWGFYALQWIRPYSPEYRGAPSFDGLSESITPRIDTWGGLLVARAFLRLSRATGEKIWRDHAWRLFDNIVTLQERDGGFCETWFLDFPSGLESIHIEPTFVTDAFVEFVLDACENEGESSLANILFKQRESVREKYSPLKPSTSSEGLVGISGDRPEWIIDGKLRLCPAFDGAYDSFNRFRRTAYTMMRRVPLGRWPLKMAPITKILLNRHRLSPPPSGIGKASRIKVTGFAEERAGDGGRVYQYLTPLHEINLSVTATGTDSDNEPAANLELGLRTVAGDIRTNQVRIDLHGRYEILSVQGRDGFTVSAGGNEYSIEIMRGAVDAIIRDGDRLAFDISLRSNWNFFGEYNLRLRVTRHPKGTTPAGA